MERYRNAFGIALVLVALTITVIGAVTLDSMHVRTMALVRAAEIAKTATQFEIISADWKQDKEEYILVWNSLVYQPQAIRERMRAIGQEARRVSDSLTASSEELGFKTWEIYKLRRDVCKNLAEAIAVGKMTATEAYGLYGRPDLFHEVWTIKNMSAVGIRVSADDLHLLTPGLFNQDYIGMRSVTISCQETAYWAYKNGQ